MKVENLHEEYTEKEIPHIFLTESKAGDSTNGYVGASIVQQIRMLNSFVNDLKQTITDKTDDAYAEKLTKLVLEDEKECQFHLAVLSAINELLSNVLDEEEDDDEAEASEDDEEEEEDDDDAEDESDDCDDEPGREVGEGMHDFDGKTISFFVEHKEIWDAFKGLVEAMRDARVDGCVCFDSDPESRKADRS